MNSCASTTPGNLERGISSLIGRWDTLKIPIIPVPVIAAPIYRLTSVVLVLVTRIYHDMYRQEVSYHPRNDCTGLMSSRLH